MKGGFILKGLDQVFYDLDGIRRRLVRLIEMDRLSNEVGNQLVNKVLKVQSEVETLILKGVDEVKGEG